jgi:hypothetical protein
LKKDEKTEFFSCFGIMLAHFMDSVLFLWNGGRRECLKVKSFGGISRDFCRERNMMPVAESLRLQNHRNKEKKKRNNLTKIKLWNCCQKLTWLFKQYQPLYLSNPSNKNCNQRKRLSANSKNEMNLKFVHLQFFKNIKVQTLVYCFLSFKRFCTL